MADELPLHHCGVMLPVSSIQNRVQQIFYDAIHGRHETVKIKKVDHKLYFWVTGSEFNIKTTEDATSNNDSIEFTVWLEITEDADRNNVFDSQVGLRFEVAFLSAPPTPDPDAYNCTCNITKGPQAGLSFPMNMGPNDFPNVVGTRTKVVDVISGQRKVRRAAEKYGFTPCCIQYFFQEAFRSLLEEGIEEGGIYIPYRDVIRQSGGVTISRTESRIYFRIPCVQVKSGNTTCTHQGECQDGTDKLVEELTGFAIPLSSLLDVPKVVQQELMYGDPDTVQLAEDFGVRVVCKHGTDCGSLGDQDGDGFCDSGPDADMCPTLFTGSNCDRDGDGFGDGALLLTSGACPIVNYMEYAHEKERLLLAKKYCGGCDNCPDYNTGLFLFNPFPETNPTGQTDRDFDGLGDECDPDADGDGVLNGFDCDWLNDRVALDLDADGICDDYTPLAYGEFGPELSCKNMCAFNSVLYEDYSLSDCEKRCELDNCIDPSSPFCEYIEQCVYLEASRRPEACPAPYCTYNHQLDVCVPHRTECAAVFGNPYQEDKDSDGLGDRCENSPLISQLEFVPAMGGAGSWPGGGHAMWCSDDRTHVSFNTMGGQPVVANDPVPEGELPQLAWADEPRTGVNIGACTCPFSGGYVDEWTDPRCNLASYCNRSGETNPNDLLHRPSWNPINSPEINAGVDLQNPRYPVHDESEHQDEIYQYSLAYDRRFLFTKNPDAQKRHVFSWNTSDSVEFFTWNSLNNKFTQALDKTRIRVAWPSFENRDSPCYDTRTDCEHEVAYTKVGADPSWCTDTSGTGPEYPVWGALITNRIPGVVDGRWDRGSWVSQDSVSRPGYLVGWDEVASVSHLYALGGEVPQVVQVWVIEADSSFRPQASLASSSGPMSLELLGLGQGERPGVVMYQQARPELGVNEPRLYIGVEPEKGAMRIRSTQELWGIDPPQVNGAQVVFMPGRQEVLLFGSSAEGAMDQVFRLRLNNGSWSGPARLSIRGEGLWGGRASLDPSSGKVVLFGTTSTGIISDVRAEVYTVDPSTLTAHLVVTETEAPQKVMRGFAGTYLDPVGQALFVYGGHRPTGPVEEHDVWRFDMAAGTWTLMTELDPLTGPEPLDDAFIYYDRKRRTVWAGNFLGKDTSLGLSVWALTTEGEWHEVPAFKLQTEADWPIDDVYAPGKTHTYVWKTAQEAEWPGQVLLARLQSQDNSLRMRVYSQSTDLLSTSSAGADGVQQAGFVCPVGQVCFVKVESMEGSSDWLPFTLTVEPAQMLEEGQTPLFGWVRGMEVDQDKVYAGGDLGLTVLAANAGLQHLDHLGGWKLGLVTGVGLCGQYLCVSRGGFFGLKVVDVSDPSDIQVKGKAFTFGPSLDMAVSGQKVYLAHGLFGVGVYDLTNPEAPHWVNHIWPGGDIASVAVRKNLLVAARRHGKVYVYDVTGSPLLAGQLQAQGKVSKVRFKAGNLWVVNQQESKAEIFSLGDPTNPVKLGEVAVGAVEQLRARHKGAMVFTFIHNKVKAYGVRTD